MSILDFQIPNKIVMKTSTDFVGVFEFGPLEKGYAITIGNALRRILLSSLEGYSIYGITVDTVQHAFSTVKNIEEDVMQLVLNLKQVRLKRNVEGEQEDFHIRLDLKGIQDPIFYAGMLEKFTPNFKVLNPELEICHLDEKGSLGMDIWIDKGRGYLPAEDREINKELINFIPIDSIYTPIKNVKYSVENIRVGQKTDFEKLIIHLYTDGSVFPRRALEEASNILIKHFMLFSEDNMTFVAEAKTIKTPIDEEFLQVRKLLKTPISDLILSVRASNCLRSANIKILGDVVCLEVSDLMKFRNFGKKSLVEIERLLIDKGLFFGMDIKKYELDKE